MKVGLFLLLFFTSFVLSAQNTGSVSGWVFSADSTIPLSEVHIQIKLLKQGTVTSKTGYFSLSPVEAGQHEIEFSMMGYQALKAYVLVEPDRNTQLKIHLETSVKKLNEIIIADHYQRLSIVSDMPFIKTEFSKFLIEEEATADIGDYLRSSKNISGIRKGGTQIDPVVRGFKFSQLNVLINHGQKIEGGCPNRMDPATAHVEVEDVEKIDVVKGPYNLRYGVGTGAMINIATRPEYYPDTAFIRLKAMKSYESNWNGNREFIAATGGNKLGFISLKAGRKDFGNYRDGNGNEVKSSFKKYNYKGSLGFYPIKNHLLLLSAEESKGRDVSFPALPMDERKDDTQMLAADYRISDMVGIIDFINLKAYRSKVRHEMDNKYRSFSDTTIAISTIDAENTGARAEVGIRTGVGSLVLGGDFEKVKKDGERIKNMILQPGLPVVREKLWNQADIQNSGFFILLSETSDRWKYNISARFDINKASSNPISIKHPQLGEIYNFGEDSISSQFNNVSFNGGVTRVINEHFSVSLAAGRATRSPDMTERFIILLPIGFDQFDYLGNPELKPEANNQVDLIFKYTHSQLGEFQLNGFYSIVNDFITGKRLPPAIQKPLSKDVLGVKQFVNSGNAKIRGLELAYASPIENKFGVSLFASYTYGTLDESIRYITNATGDVVADEIIYNDGLSEIPPFESTVTFNYRFYKGRITPNIKVRSVAAQNHVSLATYEAQTPGFVVADFGFTYLVSQYFKLTGGVKNLLDQAYYEHLNRNIIGTNYSLYEPGRSFYFSLFINFKS